jgi:acyl-CoA thioesterase-1
MKYLLQAIAITALFIELICANNLWAQTNLNPVKSVPRALLFVGDSLTSGYQIKKDEAYPFLIQKKIEQEMGEKINIIDASVSGATSLEAYGRIDYFTKAKPDIMILALGPNDGLRGLNLSATELNLQRIIENAQSANIKILLLGLKLPTNYGPKYRKSFEDIYLTLSKKYQLPLVPFLLEGVAGNK